MKKENNHIAQIVSSYQVLLDDDYPYLYIGKNINGKYVIGSFSRDDQNSKKEIYYHIVTNEKNLLDYFEQEISYYDLMVNKKSVIYQVNIFYDDRITTESISFKEIPEDYRPLEVSYYLVEKPNCFNELKKLVIQQEAKSVVIPVFFALSVSTYNKLNKYVPKNNHFPKYQAI